MPEHKVQLVEPVMGKVDAVIAGQHCLELKRSGGTPGLIHECPRAHYQGIARHFPEQLVIQMAQEAVVALNLLHAATQGLRMLVDEIEERSQPIMGGDLLGVVEHALQ
ncbi:hypothetical protein D3C80_1776860 [compost metagenome]